MRYEIGLSSWIIQDGNYGDFRVGDRAEFAIEFYPDSLEKSDAKPPALLERISPGEFTAVGRIIHLTPTVWVLDLGILVFYESQPPRGFSVGDTVLGRFSLGIDPFSYFERHYAKPKMPAMIYTWRIHQILIETAPLIESAECSNVVRNGKFLVRDPARRGRREIVETNAWEDDDGNGDYVLACELFDIPPKRSSVTACLP